MTPWAMPGLWRVAAAIVAAVFLWYPCGPAESWSEPDEADPGPPHHAQEDD